MPNTVSDRLQAAGFPTALAYEIQTQSSAGAGSVAGLIAAGMPLSTAVVLAPMMTSGTIDPDLLAATGLGHEQSRVIAKVISIAPTPPDPDPEPET